MLVTAFRCEASHAHLGDETAVIQCRVVWLTVHLGLVHVLWMLHLVRVDRVLLLVQVDVAALGVQSGLAQVATLIHALGVLMMDLLRWVLLLPDRHHLGQLLELSRCLGILVHSLLHQGGLLLRLAHTRVED